MTAASAKSALTIADHDDIEIAFAMRRSAHSEQRHHRAVVWQAVERARADHGNAVHERRVDALLCSKAHIGVAERIERDRQPARRPSRSARRARWWRARAKPSGPPPTRQHPFAHHRKRGQRRNDRAEAHQARDGDGRQHGGVGAGVHALAQRRQPPTVDDNERQDRGRQRHRHRPHAHHRRQRGGAPALLGQERERRAAAERTATSED